MADEGFAKYIGAHTFPKIWIYICILFNLVGIFTLVMVVIVELIIMIQNYSAYVCFYGYNYPSEGYVGEAGSGFVMYTNAPKHLGSAIWMLFFQMGIVVLATLVIASDLAWRTASYNEWGGRYVTAFFAVGIMAGENNKGMFYYVIANAFLKLYLTVLYMSQSFRGLNINWISNAQKSHGGYYTYSGHGTYGGGAYASADAYASTTVTTSTNVGAHAQAGAWKRADLDGHTSGVESWAIWTGWILLGSILPSIIAFMFLVPWAAQVKEAAKAPDAEKPAAPPPKEEKKKEEKPKEEKPKEEKKRRPPPKKEG